MNRVKTVLGAIVVCLMAVFVNPVLAPQALAASGSAAAASPKSMGFIGCSMAENVAQGYVAVGGTRMWGPYGTGGLVVQSWTDPNSSAWQKFDQQASKFGKPTAVWVQICIFAQNGATYDEVKRTRLRTAVTPTRQAGNRLAGKP